MILARRFTNPCRAALQAGRVALTGGILALALGGQGMAINADEPPRDANLVGVWRLVELIDYTADGEATFPMGDRPSGIFVYTAGGQLSLHIQATPPPAPLSGRDDDAGRLSAARSYIGYFGTWEADAETGELIHAIDGALIPNRIGQRAVRQYSIKGDELTITIENSDGARFIRRLERLE